MVNSILSLITGLGVGVVFSLFKMPIPAPNHINGILGIVGIFLGYMLIEWFRRR